MENEIDDKTELLMDYNTGNFGLSKEDISFLVEPDKANSGYSFQLISEKGGIQGLFQDLNINPVEGLIENEEDINSRKKYFGVNNSIIPKTKNIFLYMLSTLKERLIIFLLVALTLRMALDIYKQSNKWFDVIAIYIVILIIAIVNGITKFLKDKIFVNLHIELSEKLVRVFREGKEKMIKKSNLVVGDIMIINPGDIVNNDGIIIKAYAIELLDSEQNVKVFNNISFLKRWDSPYFRKVSKNFPFVLAGTKVVKGFAYMLILTVGENISSQVYKPKYSTFHRDVVDVTNVDSYSNKNEEDLPIIDFLKPNHNNASNINKNKKSQTMSMKITNTSSNPQDYFNANLTSNPNKLNITNNTNNLNSPSFYNNNKKLSIATSNASRKSSYEKVNNYEHHNSQYYSTLEAESLIHNNSYLNEEHYLTLKILRLTNYIAKVGLYISIIVWIQLIIRYLVSSNESLSLIFVVVDDLMYSIVLLILAIPEGLNLTFLLVVALSIKTMAKENALIKNIESLEDMACCDVLCTDFKGVISKNEATVQKIFIEDQEIDLDNLVLIKRLISDDMFAFLCESICVNSTSFLSEDGLQKNYVGNSSENALVKFIISLGENYSDFRNNYNRPIIDCSLNTPDALFTYTIIEMSEKSDKVRVYFTGDFETLIENITVYIEKSREKSYDGREYAYTPRITQMQNHHLAKLKNIVTCMISDGLTPIVLCYRDIPRVQYFKIRNNMQTKGNKENEMTDQLLRHLTLISIIGLNNEIRPESNDFIYQCNKAGIKIKMMTSLDKYTATLGAINCGLISENYDKKDNEVSSKSRSQKFNNNKNKNKSKEFNYNMSNNNCLNNIDKQYNKEDYFKNSYTENNNTDNNDLSLSDKSHSISSDVEIQENNKRQININTKQSEADINSKQDLTSKTIFTFNKKESFEGRRESILRKANFVIIDAQTEFKALVEEHKDKLSNNNSYNNNYLSSNPSFKENNKDNNNQHQFYPKSLHKKLSISATNSLLLQKSLAEMKVLYKASSVEKMFLVRFLSEMGFIVGYLGDCSSDAEGMKASHVGIAVGKSISDTSKEASDLILNQDNIHSILTTVTFGRHMFDTVRKFVVFYLSFSFSVLGIILITSFPGFYFCFYPNKLLWINLLINTLGALSFASMIPNRDELLFNKKPYNKIAPLITKEMKKVISVLTIIQITILLFIIVFNDLIFNVLYYFNDSNKLKGKYISSQIYNDSQKDEPNEDFINQKYKIYLFKTALFHILVIMQLFNALICRYYYSPLKVFSGLLRDYYFSIIQISVLILQLISVQFGDVIMKTIPLSFINHLICFIVASILFVSIPIMNKYTCLGKNEEREEEVKEIKDLLVVNNFCTIYRSPPKRRKTQLLTEVEM